MAKNEKGVVVENKEISENVETKRFDSFDINSFVGESEHKNYTLEDFKKLKESGEKFFYSFSRMSSSGCLSDWIGSDIEVRLDSEDLDGYKRKSVSRHVRAAMLDEEYGVVVVDIFEADNHTVVKVSASEVFAEQKAVLIDELDKGIELKKYIKVPARVVGLTGIDRATGKPDRSIVMLNIGGLGILGFVRLKEWSRCYTSTFRYCVKIGDVIEVVVLEKTKWKSGELYACSRRLTIDKDPWENIEKRLPQGTIVKVMCTDKTDKNFFGTVKGIPEINAYCHYPNIENGGHSSITPGTEYTGIVATVNEKKKMLRIRMVMSDSDGEK